MSNRIDEVSRRLAAYADLLLILNDDDTHLSDGARRSILYAVNVLAAPCAVPDDLDEAKQELAAIFFACARYERTSTDWCAALDTFVDLVRPAPAADAEIARLTTERRLQDETVSILRAALDEAKSERDAAVKDAERLRDAFNVALVDMARLREALDETYTFAVVYASAYQHKNQLEQIHPTHDAVLKKAYAALKGQP